jgi:hypothetical protein
MRWVLPDGAGGRRRPLRHHRRHPRQRPGLNKLEIVDSGATATSPPPWAAAAGHRPAPRYRRPSPRRRARSVAFDLATSMNSVRGANAGLGGVSGSNLFTAPPRSPVPPLPSTSIRRSPPTRGCSPPPPRRRHRLQQPAPGLLAVRDQAVGGKTLSDAAIAIVGDVGTRAAEARPRHAISRSAITSPACAIDLRRRSRRGDGWSVQHASEAMTKFLARSTECSRTSSHDSDRR